jgi:uncharacterized protein
MLRLPFMLCVLGCPLQVAIATDLVEVLFSSIYGASIYTYLGCVDFAATFFLILGGAVGAYLGAVVVSSRRQVVIGRLFRAMVFMCLCLVVARYFGFDRLAYWLPIVGCAVASAFLLKGPYRLTPRQGSDPREVEAK